MRSHAKAPKIFVALSVTDKMPVGTLMKEFTTNFPYLGLKLYRCEANKLYRVPVDQPLAAVRADDTTDNSETVEPTIIIRGGMTIGQIERIFKEIYGLHVHVCYRPNNEEYIAKSKDELCTLMAFNRMREIANDNPYQYD